MPLLRGGLIQADALVDIRGVVPRGIDEDRIGAGATLAELECDPQVPAALREACRLAASPQLRNMGSLAGNLLQATRCWYWRLELAVPPARRRRVLRAGGRAPRACDLRERLLRVRRIRPTSRQRCSPSTRRSRTDRRELPIAELYRVPTEDDRRTTTLEPGELLLEVELPEVEASVYLKAMERKRWAFPLVGVAAARIAGATRVALAGVAPIPWLLDGAARRGDAAAAERVQGRPGEGARPARGNGPRSGLSGTSTSHGTPLRAAARARPRARRLRRRRLEGLAARRPRRRRTPTAARPSSSRSPTARKAAKPTTGLDPSKTYTVTMQTNCGSFTIGLAVKTAPATTASFVSLVRARASTTTRSSTGSCPASSSRAATRPRAAWAAPATRPSTNRRPTARYTLGTVAMAKTQAEPDGTSGSQFFIVTAQDAQLPPRVRDARRGQGRARHGDEDRRARRCRRPSSRPRSSRSRRRPSPASDRRGRRARRGRGDPVRRPEAGGVPPGRPRRAGRRAVGRGGRRRRRSPTSCGLHTSSRRAVRRWATGPAPRCAAASRRSGATSSTRSSSSRTGRSSIRGPSSA